MNRARMLVSLVVAGGLALITGSAAVAAVEEAPQAPQVVAATALAEVDPLGLKVTGIALEYDQPLGAAQLSQETAAQSFEVKSTLCLTQDSCAFEDEIRTITKGYTAASATITDVVAEGNFLVLELSAEEPAASAAISDGTFNAYYDLTESLRVRQVQELMIAGATLPAQEEHVVTSGSKRMIVDDYEAHTLMADSGVALPYRKFTPALVAGKKYPLVVSLHGHGESGTDNLAQISGNQQSLSFAVPERQASDPSFIISPQTTQGVPLSGDGTGWWDAQWRAAVIQVVEETIAANPQIDGNRVYLTGLSMGAFGSWGILQERSDLFAGAVLVCGLGDSEAALAELTDFPIWVTHSEDDIVVNIEDPNSGKNILKAFDERGVPVTWSQWSGIASDEEQTTAAQAAWDEATTANSKHIMTVFPEGTTPVFNHFSWVPTYSNSVILDWLFSQERVAEETPDTAPQITVAPGKVTAGAAVAVSGSGFAPNDNVVLTLNTDPAATVQVTTDAQGAFQANIVTPKGAATGTFELTATVAGEQVATADISITAVIVEGSDNTEADGPADADTDNTLGDGSDEEPDADNNPAPQPAKDENLAQTGARDSVLLTVLVGLLVVGGAGLLVARRAEMK